MGLQNSLRGILALLIALAASSAYAENARLEAAKRLYSRAELDAAMAELKAAEDSSKDDNDLVSILIYRGLIYAETGQGQQMQESFKRALAMRPWAEVPQDASPRLAKMFQDARREVWGSSIKPWPKKKEGAPTTPPGGSTPAEPPKTTEPPSTPETKPDQTPPASTPPAKPPAPEPEKPAAAKPGDDAPPEVPPSDVPPSK